jgi:hypothetical protein
MMRHAAKLIAYYPHNVAVVVYTNTQAYDTVSFIESNIEVQKLANDEICFNFPPHFCSSSNH